MKIKVVKKNSAPSALSSLESVVDVDVSTGKNVRSTETF